MAFPRPGGGGSGTVSEITSDDATVDITDPTGPTVDLSVPGGGGGLPAWFQSGDGDPITTNPTPPDVAGALYFDTSGASGLWVSPNGTTWIALGGIFGGGANGGLTFAADGGVGLISLGAPIFIESGPGSVGGEIKLSPTDFNLLSAVPWMQFNTSTGIFVLFINAGNPNGVLTAFDVGDLCIDTTTPVLWQATAADDSHWIQIGGILPTSAAGLVTGSLWNNSGVVNVA